VRRPSHGTVTVADKLARWVRLGLTEEYSVSVDGVRQDFVVTQRPAGDGALRVELDVTGARAEALGNGARLVLNGSGRKLAYSRLQVVDAAGKALTARMEVTTEARLAVLVDDAAAAYPVSIDPTFSDADWISMGGLPGANGNVYVTVVDSSGNLFVGGFFTIAGEAPAKNVAKWNGSAWSALGLGVNGSVYSLAVSGSDLYVGGEFTTAGSTSANYVAKWNGNAWSALGSGLNSRVDALAVSGSDLYVGGWFNKADRKVSAYLAKANLGGAAPAAPVFTSIVPNPSGAQVLLTYVSDPGASFYLLSTTNLATWQTNSMVNAIGATNSVLINVTQPYEFFRLRSLP